MSNNPAHKPGKVTGSCACRRIAFETPTNLGSVTACYCRECAKISGNGYLTFGNFVTSDIKWSVEPDVWSKSDIAERGYCKQCGSTVSMLYYCESEQIGIALSMIDISSEPLPQPAKHIFLDEKADWVQVPEDGKDKFGGNEPGFHTRLSEWKQSQK